MVATLRAERKISRLEHWRRAKGYSQHELGRLAEIPQRTISYLENEPEMMKLGQARRLARALRVSVHDLYE